MDPNAIIANERLKGVAGLLDNLAAAAIIAGAVTAYNTDTISGSVVLLETLGLLLMYLAWLIRGHLRSEKPR